ncbi:MAG TPA: hypothetical protein VNW72_04270 [Chthoniobacterales bacterium]|nr:hypothetical protein [Chthoniobacterales bacterium]
MKQVEEKHRLRITEDIVATVRWLNISHTSDCLAWIGSLGQLQIGPASFEKDLEDQLNTELRKTPAQAREASSEWVAAARLAASKWNVKITAEPQRKRMSLVLPKEARDLGVVPSVGSHAGIFTAGDIFEIWKSEQWVEHVRLTRQRFRDMTDSLSDDLAGR